MLNLDRNFEENEIELRFEPDSEQRVMARDKGIVCGPGRHNFTLKPPDVRSEQAASCRKSQVLSDLCVCLRYTRSLGEQLLELSEAH